jgi:UDP:flavonoid glycosyltransferase YjiC (YdhE family)
MSLDLPGPFEQFFQRSLAVVSEAGARAVVIGVPHDRLPDPLPREVCAVPYAPFSTVYPRCAAVIHHGGIGTVAQALRAGVPMFMVPWGVDQFYHSAQVARIGAGRWLQRNVYTVERAVPLLGELLNDSSYRQRAQTLAARIASEDGVAMLCDGLEALL